MKHFSFSDMNRLSGEILENALLAPVVLTKRGKEKLVILSAARYRQLIGQTATAAYTIKNAPDSVHNELMKGLDAILESDSQDA
jgi:prevent-host-death family protein